MLVRPLREQYKQIQYESYSIVELLKVIFLNETIKQTTFEKVLYRLNNNLVCDYYYLRYMLDLEEDVVMRFLALLEVMKRKVNSTMPLKAILSPKDFAISLSKHCQYLPHESFFLGLLNSQNILFELKQLTFGQVDSVTVDIKSLMKHVLCEQAPRVIIGHNHPSGNPEPSEQDKILTKRIHYILSCFGLELLDHVIIGRKSYYSFKNKRILCL